MDATPHVSVTRSTPETETGVASKVVAVVTKVVTAVTAKVVRAATKVFFVAVKLWWRQPRL